MSYLNSTPKLTCSMKRVNFVTCLPHLYNTTGKSLTGKVSSLTGIDIYVTSVTRLKTYIVVEKAGNKGVPPPLCIGVSITHFRAEHIPDKRVKFLTVGKRPSTL